MNFQMRKDAYDWFTHVEKHFTTHFEKYYLCLMLGLAARTKKSVPANKLRDLTDTFPEEWKQRSRLLIALLLSAHLDTLGIDYSEKETVNKQLESLLDPERVNQLSTEGMRLMNEYAAGGFDVLLDQVLSEKPRSPETLIRAYAKTLRRILQDRKSA